MITDVADISALAVEVGGPVLVPGYEGYAAETATWNTAVPQRPAVVVGATGVADVQAAVRFADARNLSIAVVAAGHGAFVPSDGALLINLRRLDSVVIDPDARTATVGGGVAVQSLVEQAAARGLAPIAGSNGTVGVVGFTLGGGLSPVLGRTYGFAADHVRSVEIVTPDGELRHVDAASEPDLFWALRGGKGNFGVVTSLTIDLFPITRLYGGGLFFAGENAPEVIAAYRRLIADAPRDLTASFAFMRYPDLPMLPEPLRGRLSLHVRIAYLGSSSEGQNLVADLRAAAPALIDTVAEMPYTAIASIHAEAVDPQAGYGHATLLSGFPAEAADALIAAAGPGVETSAAMIEVRHFGGAMAEPPETPNAVGNRTAPFQYFAAAAAEPGMTETFRPELDKLIRALAPWENDRRTINFMEVYDTTPEAVATGYEPEAYARLSRIKHQYDPKNLFRFNQNIS